MNQLEKILLIPKPILVFFALCTSIFFIVLLNPMKNECDVKIDFFNKQIAGILKSKKIKIQNKSDNNIVTQFPQLSIWKERCLQGNNSGACEDYLNALKKIGQDFLEVPEKCQIKYAEDSTQFLKTINDGVLVLSLLAWGDKPPSSNLERIGWLSETDLRTFCKLKKISILISSEEEFQSFSDYVYTKYPDNWPDNIDEAQRDPSNRPLAMKSNNNPIGRFDKKQIYDRSLFSLKCNLFE